MSVIELSINRIRNNSKVIYFTGIQSLKFILGQIIKSICFSAETRKINDFRMFLNRPMEWLYFKEIAGRYWKYMKEAMNQKFIFSQFHRTIEAMLKSPSEVISIGCDSTWKGKLWWREQSEILQRNNEDKHWLCNKERRTKKDFISRWHQV